MRWSALLLVNARMVAVASAMPNAQNTTRVRFCLHEHIGDHPIAVAWEGALERPDEKIVNGLAVAVLLGILYLLVRRVFFRPVGLGEKVSGESVVIGLFDATIEQVVALAILMPIVASMGGNAGTQALALPKEKKRLLPSLS